MKCTQCGAQVDGDFCPYCGATPEAKTADTTMEQPSETPMSSTTIKPVKEKKPFFKKWWFWVVAAFVVIGVIGNLGGNNSSYDEIEEFEWENMVLAEMLPEPPSNKGSNLMNSDSYLSIHIHDVSKNEYKDYVNACREKGFTEDLSETSDFYSATNKAGYKLMLYYYDDDKEMSINLSAPSEEEKQEYEIDYSDAASFEKALNDGEKVNGKVVQFDVIEYKPDSALGINCWSGEHLNFISDEELDVKKGDIVIGRVKKEPTKALGSWRISYEVLAINEAEETKDTRSEKNGFDSKTNEKYQLAGYTVEIPKYWTSENKIASGIQRYAEKSGKVAMLQVTAQKETDNSYPVTFDGLKSDNDNMIAMIESTAFTKVTSHEVIDTGAVKGILYKGTIDNMSDGLSGEGLWFAFASEGDRNWCSIVMCQSDNTEFVYNDDFMKIIRSLKVVEKKEEPKPATEPEKPYSEYEKAYIRDLSNYDLYYMFDTDTKKVVYFGTNDTYIEKGTYTGDFATGVTITWSHGEWTEKFTHKSGNSATLIDGNGYDWAYKTCEVKKAQDALNGLK